MKYDVMKKYKESVQVTLVPYGLTKRSCYVIAACSEKERPDSFNHSKNVHLNLLQISPRSAQYNGQRMLANRA